MTPLNHTDSTDAVVAAYIHEISARHAGVSPQPVRRGDRPRVAPSDPMHGARRRHSQVGGDRRREPARLG
jgi:hypothetical protein